MQGGGAVNIQAALRNRRMCKSAPVQNVWQFRRKNMEDKLFHLVEKGTSAVMVVQEAARQLEAAGF